MAASVEGAGAWPRTGSIGTCHLSRPITDRLPGSADFTRQILGGIRGLRHGLTIVA